MSPYFFTGKSLSDNYWMLVINIYIYIYIYRERERERANVVPGFSSYSSFYCYSPVSYGQEVTTLIRQLERMAVNLTAGGIIHMTVNLKAGGQHTRSCITLRIILYSRSFKTMILTIF